MALAEGTRVGRYRIESVLGRGGMSVVYRARGDGIDRDVALKLLAEDLRTTPESVYEAGDSEYGLYQAMRLVLRTTRPGASTRARSRPRPTPASARLMQRRGTACPSARAA